MTIVVLGLAILDQHEGILNAGIVTAKTSNGTSNDSSNNILADKDDTVIFTAKSGGNDDKILLNDSTFQNGTASYGGAANSPTATVTFTTKASGNQNKCTIKVNSWTGKTVCSKDAQLNFTVDVVKVSFQEGGSVVANPFRLGMSGDTDRSRNLTATVAPASDVSKITLYGDSKLSLTNINNGNSNITFNLAGATASAKAGDALLKAKITSSGEELVGSEAPVSVIKPATLECDAYNGNCTTVNVVNSEANNTVALLTAVSGASTTMHIYDNLKQPMDSLFSGSSAIEYRNSSAFNVGSLSETGTYSDPLGLAVFKSGSNDPQNGDIVASDSSAAKSWPTDPPASSGSTTTGFVIIIDKKFAVTPQVSRTLQFTAPKTLQVNGSGTTP